MADDDFFGGPPADPPPPPEGTEENPAFMGDMNAGGGGYETMGDAFGGGGEMYAPMGDDGGNAFASPPEGGDMFGAPPAEGGGDFFGGAEPAPIILGAPPPEQDGGYGEGDAEGVAGNAGPTEPTPMQKWNTEWQETLKTRKDEENNSKAQMLENARLELEAFQEEREKKSQARMAKNREDESAKLEAIEADLENDSSWQRVCKMIELQHDSTDKAEDVKRMRDTLIALKNETGKAAELGQ